MINALLVLALGVAAVFLARQFKISKRRANDLETSIARNASTMGTALDAIIVIDTEGNIIDFNPAASHTFGYSQNFAIGSRFEDLIIPEKHREDLRKKLEQLHSDGTQKTVDFGRVELSAIHANGEEFPIELSIGMTDGPSGRVFISFLRDISQRVNQEKELLAARDEALESAKAKSQFLAVMSHEMRTPLNGVMAVLDLLQNTVLTDKQKTYIKTASTSSEILKQHIDDVLDLTRIQAGKMELFPIVFNLVELLEEVQSLNLPIAASRSNKIFLNTEMPQPYFVGDRKRIHQVLTNFVGNAIKFTEAGNITIASRFISASAERVEIELSVSDTGLGIATNQQARIFDDFVTLQDAHQSTANGTGLGLSICRDIAAAMNGSIGVESEVGRGSRFWIRLSLKAAFAKKIIPAPTSKTKKPLRRLKKLRVLLVDDNETNRFVAKELLQYAHCEVDEAENGETSVRKAAQKYYDLILMDISMPGMNGWDAAKEIRSQTHSKSRLTPIHALSAHSLPQERLSSEISTMQGAVVKPIRERDIQKLVSLIRTSGGELNPETSKSIVNTDASFDQSVLAELKELLPTHVFNERLTAYISELSSDSERLLKLTAKFEPTTFAKYLHRMAGSAAVFGAINLRTELLVLESSIHEVTRKQLLAKCTLIQHSAKSHLSYLKSKFDLP